jgi:hypothetical protein
VGYKSIELGQEYRFFKFSNPWSSGVTGLLHISI